MGIHSSKQEYVEEQFAQLQAKLEYANEKIAQLQAKLEDASVNERIQVVVDRIANEQSERIQAIANEVQANADANAERIQANADANTEQIQSYLKENLEPRATPFDLSEDTKHAIIEYMMENHNLRWLSDEVEEGAYDMILTVVFDAFKLFLH